MAARVLAARREPAPGWELHEVVVTPLGNLLVAGRDDGAPEVGRGPGNNPMDVMDLATAVGG